MIRNIDDRVIYMTVAVMLYMMAPQMAMFFLLFAGGVYLSLLIRQNGYKKVLNSMGQKLIEILKF